LYKVPRIWVIVPSIETSLIVRCIMLVIMDGCID
jgi:hypothetical protein